MDPLAVTNAMTGVAAIALGVYGVRETRRRGDAEDARAEAEAALQREREVREEERRSEEERRETMRERPVLVVEHAGATTDGVSLERRLVKVQVTNKGPSVAHSVEVGIKIDGHDMMAGPGGSPRRLEALSPNDACLLVVQVDHAVWFGRPLFEVDDAELWARWTDALGNPYEWPSPDDD